MGIVGACGVDDDSKSCSFNVSVHKYSHSELSERIQQIAQCPPLLSPLGLWAVAVAILID